MGGFLSIGSAWCDGAWLQIPRTQEVSKVQDQLGLHSEYQANQDYNCKTLSQFKK